MSPIRILPSFAIETPAATAVNLQFRMSSLEKTRKFKKRRDCDLNSLQRYVEKTKNKKVYVKWTKVEQAALEMGMKEFGEGRWKEIKNFYSVLKKKTTLQLKDKNRNMKKRRNKKVVVDGI